MRQVPQARQRRTDTKGKTMNEEIATGQDPAVRDKANSEQPIDCAQIMPAMNSGSGGAVNGDGAGGAPGAEEDAVLTPEQVTALVALVENPDVQMAADAAGVNRATIYRWMNKPGFQSELTRQRNEAFAVALASVKTHAGRAVAQLAGMLDASDERVRRLVCNDILAHGMKAHDIQDIQERLNVLERNMKQQKNAQRGR